MRNLPASRFEVNKLSEKRVNSNTAGKKHITNA